jgi:nicotinate-nucleotide adenylyltransferase
MKRIGIYAGTFDPVHSGHITFALQAIKAADLDRVYFLPERRPRGKQGVEHFGHRVAMLSRAIKPHPKFGVLELVDVSFTVSRTLTYLENEFPAATLAFLVGSDLLATLPDWPHADKLLSRCELVIAARETDDIEKLKAIIDGWSVKPKAATLFVSYAPDISSSKIRAALMKRKHAKGLLKSVQRYSDKHWLYVSVG